MKSIVQMMKLLLITLLLLAGSTAAAEVFKCVDSKGTVSYTDQPCAKSSTTTILTKSDLEKKEYTIHSPILKLPSQIHPNTLRLIAAAYSIMSVLCYYFYFMDKLSAGAGDLRTPESRLHLVELLGGWPGALLAQFTLRHKTRKLSYQLVFWLIVGIHIAVWMDFLVLNHALANSVKTYLSTITIA